MRVWKPRKHAIESPRRQFVPFAIDTKKNAQIKSIRITQGTRKSRFDSNSQRREVSLDWVLIELVQSPAAQFKPTVCSPLNFHSRMCSKLYSHKSASDDYDGYDDSDGSNDSYNSDDSDNDSDD